MKLKLINQLLYGSTICISLWMTSTHGGMSSYSRCDPYPVFTTESPYERPFLFNRERFIDKDSIERQRWVPQRWFFSLSPYGQNASSTRNARREIIPLGDINGRWSMLPLLFGCTPCGSELPPILVEAQRGLYPTLLPPICDQPLDPTQQFGFFSIDLNYQRRGLRWDASLRICNNVVLNVQGGVSDICQTVSLITNLTDASTDTFSDPCNPALTQSNVDQLLMNRLCEIADAICLDMSCYHLTTAEDLRFNLIWRNIHQCDMIINDFADLYIMPFALLSGSVAVGKNPCTNAAWGISHGNNGHHSLGGIMGINFDFVETVDFGAEIGAVHFFPRDICCFRVPNDPCQQGIFPFSTDIRRAPGWNWHFAMKLGAYHFVGLLSFYFQYVLVQHQDDSYCLKCPNKCFEPCQLQKCSGFKSQVANIGFNYDICPDLSLGFLWQAPLMQCHAYRASTIMFSLNAFY